MNNQQHTAIVGKPKNDKKSISGQFSYADGKLNFTCSTANVSFGEVEQALTALRNEVQRQLDNKHLCPFYEPQKTA